MIEGHVLDQLADYIFGYLDVAERGSVEDHLRHCDVCHAEFLALQEAAGQLAQAAPAVVPPARVKKAILRRATPLANWFRSRRPLWRGRLAGAFQSLSPAWAAVALVIILSLAGTNLLTLRQVRQLSAPNQIQMQTVALVSGETAPGATGVLVITANGRFGTLVVDGLPVLDAQHQYQMWLIEGGQRTNGGVFSVDSEGYGAMIIDSPQPLNQYQHFGVTIEPLGGSPGPTGVNVLSGNL